MKLICGLDRLQNSFEEFIQQGEQYVRDAASGRSFVHCLRDPSLIRRASSTAPRPLNSLSIALDVGGTHTKAALATFTSGCQESWQVLFDIENSDLLGGASAELPIKAFCARVAEECRAVITQSGCTASAVRSVSIVWSNQIESAPLKRGGVSGVTGLVSGIAAGTYRKSEWFIDGLHDGYDLGTLFLDSFHSEGFAPEVFLIANDTVFTLTALPGSHAGVVASSGGNCTDVGVSGAEQDLIFNTELGSLFKIAPAHLSEGDVALSARTGSPVALEDLLSGKWLPRLLDEHIIVSARAGVVELQDLAARISSSGSFFTTQDMANVLSSQPPRAGAALDSDSAALVQELSSHIVARAGMAAGALCYFSLFNQICAGRDDLIVALDSAMARHLPGYFTSLEKTLHRLLERKGVRGNVTLLRPTLVAGGEQISVPLIGALFAGALALTG